MPTLRVRIPQVLSLPELAEKARNQIQLQRSVAKSKGKGAGKGKDIEIPVYPRPCYRVTEEASGEAATDVTPDPDSYTYTYTHTGCVDGGESMADEVAEAPGVPST